MKIYKNLIITYFIVTSSQLYANILSESAVFLPGNLDVSSYFDDSIDINICSAQEKNSKPKSLVKLEKLLLNMNSLFGTNVDFILDDSEVCKLGIPHFEATDDGNGKKLISLCSSTFEKVDNGSCGVNREPAMAFIIAHEFSHHLISEGDNYDYDKYNLNNKKFLDGLSVKEMSEIKVKASMESKSVEEYLDQVVFAVEHEHVDEFAAKILKELGYGVEIKEGISCMESLYTNLSLSDEHRENRISAIEKSYLEGWEAWSDYKSFFPIDNKSLDTFLESRNYTSIRKSLNDNVVKQVDENAWNKELQIRLDKYQSSLIVYNE